MLNRTRTRLRRIRVLALLASTLLATGTAGAAEPPSGACQPDEPDSLQISWDSPCQDGTWLMDTELGCRMWDWHPAPEDAALWTGACRDGMREGRGVVQWFEHGRPIDQFEGAFVSGRRQGRGRYAWNETDWYEGFYEDDLPHGPGTASIAGKVFAGRWKRGCFTQGADVVAIGTSRRTCEAWLTSGL